MDVYIKFFLKKINCSNILIILPVLLTLLRLPGASFLFSVCYLYVLPLLRHCYCYRLLGPSFYHAYCHDCVFYVYAGGLSKTFLLFSANVLYMKKNPQ